MATLQTSDDKPSNWSEQEVGTGLHAHDDAAITADMKAVRQSAFLAYEAKTGKPVSASQRAFCTSTTLKHYVDPLKPEHLISALIRRDKQREVLLGKNVYLANSLRVMGWDQSGSSILLQDTMGRASFSKCIDQIEYVVGTALDLNKPGCDDVLFISHYPNGFFNPMQFLNPAPLLDVAQMLEGQFRRRLKVSLMVGMPRAFGAVFNILLKAVKPETRRKFVICSTESEAISELRNVHGVDEATLARIQASFDNRLDHRASPRQHQLRWSPIVEHPYFEKELADLQLDGASLLRLNSEMHGRLRKAIDGFHHEHWNSSPRSVIGRSG